MATVIHTTASRDDIVRFIRALPGRLTGRVADPHGIGRGFRARVGWVLFSLITKAFQTKGRGGTDEAGEKWLPLTPEYLAYQKGRAKGQKRKDAYRVKRASHLNADQKKAWTRANSQALKDLATRVPANQLRGRAATIAWAATRKAGADTLASRYGNRQDQILVDHGDLRRSLQYGELTEADAAATYQPADPAQVYQESTGQLVCGTRDPKAAYHHESPRLYHGAPGKGTVRRRLWPDRFPESWWRQIIDRAVDGLKRIEVLFHRGDFR